LKSAVDSGQAEEALRAALEGLLAKRLGADLDPDPILFPHRYADPRDAEVAAFIAASFAFGGVLQIRRFLERLFDVIDPSPFEALTASRPVSKEAVKSLAHRFISPEGVHRFLFVVRECLLAHGSLEGLYLHGREKDEPELRRDLGRFLSWFRGQWGENIPRQRDFLFPRPERGSACKRHNLFMRWMVRGPDGVDLGLWKAVSTRDLVVPLDTHMALMGERLALTGRKVRDWRMAEEITSSLRTIRPEDPVAFDYPLTRIGILRVCTLRRRGDCLSCTLAPLCRRKTKRGK
jgi:uncharacterized protein (TIGR02757 family)